jgi:hypothetical protein
MLFPDLSESSISEFPLGHAGYESLLTNMSIRVTTGVTFKQAKGDLTKKGWDPRLDWKGDKLYWLNGTKYERLDERSWSSIESGQAKL